MNAAKLHKERQRMDPGIEIRVWMLRNRIRAVDLARELGVTRSAIANFINGEPRAKSRRIWNLFVDKGCPEDLLKQLWGVE
jgi:transcriptional regulator with XRE-family HTH domain